MNGKKVKGLDNVKRYAILCLDGASRPAATLFQSEQIMTTITLPSTLKVESALKTIVDVETKDWSAEFVAYLCVYAWKIRMDRSTASAKDPAKARQDMFNGMVKGELPTRGGGATGPRDAEAKYLSEYLNKKDKKFAGSIKDVEARLLRFALAINAQKPVLERDEPETVKANLEAFKATVKASPGYQAIVRSYEMGGLSI